MVARDMGKPRAAANSVVAILLATGADAPLSVACRELVNTTIKTTTMATAVPASERPRHLSRTTVLVVCSAGCSSETVTNSTVVGNSSAVGGDSSAARNGDLLGSAVLT